MSDDDMIRRGDALECFMGYDRTGDIKDAIAALPAMTVRVKDKRWIMEERDRTFALMLARAERLEAVLREIIDEDQHQSEWRYWEKEDGHWARKARAALEELK